MKLLAILTESQPSKFQQDLVQTQTALEQRAADYAQQVAAYNKWNGYVAGLAPQLEAVAAKFSATPYVHNKGVGFNFRTERGTPTDKEAVAAACAPFKVKVDIVDPFATYVQFILDKMPKYPSVKS